MLIHISALMYTRGDSMKEKTNWVYEPKTINIKRGICYGLTDLMGGGWNNIVSGVIFAFVLSQGISPAFAGAITGIGRIFDAIFSLFLEALRMNFIKRNWENDLDVVTFSYC